MSITSNEPMSTFAVRVKALRKAAGLNQPQLAGKVGVTKAAIGSIEKGGTKEVKMLLLFKMAATLGVGARFLATGKGSPLALGQIDEAEGELIDLYRHCSESLQQTILSSARAFAGSDGYSGAPVNKAVALLTAEKLKK